MVKGLSLIHISIWKCTGYWNRRLMYGFTENSAYGYVFLHWWYDFWWSSICWRSCRERCSMHRSCERHWNHAQRLSLIHIFGIKKTKNALPIGLLADVAGIAMAIFLTVWFFGWDGVKRCLFKVTDNKIFVKIHRKAVRKWAYGERFDFHIFDMA